ncbi:hypothetical protein EVAR_93653_1 [Eumeta japonica]|uniref:Uncharacterized protein n=1 Tax=Eumeta variegata TaxID=151549 RepID=A0A4C1TQM5_EUMVA|nr:hypothetical protein EVAR_93653_1 [Eumeta japonica]
MTRGGIGFRSFFRSTTFGVKGSPIEEKTKRLAATFGNVPPTCLIYEFNYEVYPYQILNRNRWRYDNRKRNGTRIESRDHDRIENGTKISIDKMIDQYKKKLHSTSTREKP